MKAFQSTLVCTLLAMLATVSAANGKTAQESFALGKAALAKGDFDTAKSAYASAAKADRTNPQYAQQYAMLRQVTDMRRNIEAEKDPRRWEYSARALRAFYLNEGLAGEALAIDRQLNDRLKTAESALMLAETQLSLGQNADAAKTLEALPPEQVNTATRAILGVALVRDGKAEDAKKIAVETTLPTNASPGVAYAVARLYAAAGDPAKSITTLKACFESVPPSRLDALKNHARACAEFHNMTSMSEFAAVMTTVSKVAESKCSGGSGCGNCPMSSSCPKSKGK